MKKIASKPACASWIAFASMLLSLSLASLSAKGQDSATVPTVIHTDAAVHALCGKPVVLLGESAIHGFGETLEFKAQLVRRLVEECHFNALFVESGIYDYLHIERARSSGQEVSDAMVSAAIGGLWANREVQGLVPFLTDKVRAGTLTLGGLDDQLGAGTYASRAMAADLVQPLAPDESSRCRAIFERHLLWQYTDDSPYSPADKARLLGCLNEIQTQLASHGPATKFSEQSKVMVESLQRNLARNFTEDDFKKKDQSLKWMNDRDHSMYLNFEWLRQQLPPHSKIIVWAATVHTAKDLTGLKGFEGRVPLGSYIHQALKGEAFSLGFSAYAGEYSFTHQPVRRLSDAPPNSLEANVFAHGSADAVYLSAKQLHRYGPIAARPLEPEFTTARWDQVVDGLVLFRNEHAPAWLNPAAR